MVEPREWRIMITMGGNPICYVSCVHHDVACIMLATMRKISFFDNPGTRMEIVPVYDGDVIQNTVV